MGLQRKQIASPLQNELIFFSSDLSWHNHAVITTHTHQKCAEQKAGIGSGGGAGGFGIANFSSTIDTRSGNDVIIGGSGAKNLGIYTLGRIELGSDNDLITASGIFHRRLISMGSGNHFIRVESSDGAQEGGA
jgi:hypothetical protein